LVEEAPKQLFALFRGRLGCGQSEDFRPFLVIGVLDQEADVALLQRHLRRQETLERKVDEADGAFGRLVKHCACR